MSDIAAISQLTQSNVAAQISMKVAIKTKDIARAQGDAINSLLQTAASISQSLASDPAKGHHLDVTG